jgi:hypothetical protein
MESGTSAPVAKADYGITETTAMGKRGKTWRGEHREVPPSVVEQNPEQTH